MSHFILHNTVSSYRVVIWCDIYLLHHIDIISNQDTFSEGGSVLTDGKIDESDTKSDRKSNSLSNSAQHRHSSEADSHSAGQNIPRILWNPKLHYCIYNSSLDSVLRQLNESHLRLPLPGSYTVRMLYFVTRKWWGVFCFPPLFWRTTSFRLSTTTCSKYTQISSTSADGLLHPQPEVVPCHRDKNALNLEWRIYRLAQKSVN
jgi:hypothetical protein